MAAKKRPRSRKLICYYGTPMLREASTRFVSGRAGESSNWNRHSAPMSTCKNADGQDQSIGINEISRFPPVQVACACLTRVWSSSPHMANRTRRVNSSLSGGAPITREGAPLATEARSASKEAAGCRAQWSARLMSMARSIPASVNCFPAGVLFAVTSAVLMITNHCSRSATVAQNIRASRRWCRSCCWRTGSEMPVSTWSRFLRKANTATFSQTKLKNGSLVDLPSA